MIPQYQIISDFPGLQGGEVGGKDIGRKAENVDLVPENTPNAGGAIGGMPGPRNASILNNVIMGNSAWNRWGLLGYDGTTWTDTE